MPTTRTIDLDPATKDAGLALFTAQAAAEQAVQDWLTEQRKAYALEDPAINANYNPFTGRLTAVVPDPPMKDAG